MAFQVTQCPHCESTFNTDPRILDMAAGKVRCGACLTVFLAAENFLSRADGDTDETGEESVFIGHDPADFIDPSKFLTRGSLADETVETMPELSNPQAAPDQTTIEPPAITDNLATEAIEEAAATDDSSISDPQQQESQDGPEYLEFFSAVDESLEQFDESDDITDLEQIAALDPADNLEAELIASFEDSESGAESGHESESQTEPAPEPEHPSQAESIRRPLPEDISLSASFSLDFGRVNKVEQPPEETPVENPQPPTEKTHIDRPVVPEDENLEELVRLAIEEQDFAAAIETGMQDASEGVTSDRTDPVERAAAPEEEEFGQFSDQAAGPEELEEDEDEVDTSTEAIRARALQQELRDEDALDAIPRENLSSLKKIATPLELSSSRQKSLGRRLGMLAVILLLATTLAGQYLWRHRETFSVDPRFREAFLFACTQLRAVTQSGCNLPEYSNIEAIRSDNLAVRSHPQREDGLMVTVEIRNTASFPQRFPVLILGFNGANNQTIALREFAPEEYLDAGLREIEFMPVASPVQISLPIMDPGEDAVNYTLAFRER